MDLRLSDEEQLVVATFRRFADVEMRKVAAEADRLGTAPAGFERGARDQLGVGPDAVPVDAGGLCEGAYSHVARALRGFELGRGCPALGALLEAPVDVALAAGRFGGGAARAVLGAIAAGGRATSASDDAGRLSLKGASDGALVVSGVLPAVPALDGASHLLVVAHAEAPVVLLLEAASFEQTPMVPSAWRAAAWARATLSEVRVPPENVLARGHGAAREVLATIRLSLAARAVGAAEAALAHARRYASDRVQFGRAIGQFESLARLLDRGETLVTAARLMVLAAALLLDQAADDRARDAACDAVSRARDFTSEALSRVAVDAVQVHGGYGFVNDFPVEKLMRDARAFDAVTGDEAFERVLARSRPAARGEVA